MRKMEKSPEHGIPWKKTTLGWSDTLGEVVEEMVNLTGNSKLKEGLALVKEADGHQQRSKEHLEKAKEGVKDAIQSLERIKRKREHQREEWSRSPLLSKQAAKLKKKQATAKR